MPHHNKLEHLQKLLKCWTRLLGLGVKEGAYKVKYLKVNYVLEIGNCEVTFVQVVD